MIQLNLFPVPLNELPLDVKVQQKDVHHSVYLSGVVRNGHDLEALYGRLAPSNSVTHFCEVDKRFEPVNDSDSRLEVTVMYFRLK